jgi:hypothetical protein
MLLHASTHRSHTTTPTLHQYTLATLARLVASKKNHLPTCPSKSLIDPSLAIGPLCMFRRDA